MISGILVRSKVQQQIKTMRLGCQTIATLYILLESSVTKKLTANRMVVHRRFFHRLRRTAGRQQPPWEMEMELGF